MTDIADSVADRIREETESFQSRASTQRELTAAEILHRCYRFGSPEVFAFVPTLPGARDKLFGAPWRAGDLAAGETGSEFIFAYLPVSFVEKLLERIERAGFQALIAETLTTGATVYFLNNLRRVIDEALIGLSFEASMVADILTKAVTDIGIDHDRGLNLTRESFAKIRVMLESWV